MSELQQKSEGEKSRAVERCKRSTPVVAVCPSASATDLCPANLVTGLGICPGLEIASTTHSHSQLRATLAAAATTASARVVSVVSECSLSSRSRARPTALGNSEQRGHQGLPCIADCVTATAQPEWARDTFRSAEEEEKEGRGQQKESVTLPDQTEGATDNISFGGVLQIVNLWLATITGNDCPPLRRHCLSFLLCQLPSV